MALGLPLYACAASAGREFERVGAWGVGTVLKIAREPLRVGQKTIVQSGNAYRGIKTEAD
jgi:hypothetical protein